MSINTPPNPNVDTFNNLYWFSGDDSLTQSQADLRYLKFPVAQGTENLKQISVDGIATFTNDIIQSSSETNNITQQTIDTNSNQNTLRKTFIYGDLQLKRPTSDNGGAFWLWDVGSGISGFFSQLYQTGTTLVYYNKSNTGSHSFWNLTSGGGQVNTLNFTDTNMTISTTNPPTCNASSAILTSDSSNKIPSTAWVKSVVSSGNTTYTIQYTSTQSITLPTNCIGISVRCIGQGGNAGVSNDGNGGTWGAGGSGGGGGTVYSLGIIPLYAGTVLQLNFAGYTEILLTTFGSASLCRANVGGTGGNSSGSNGGVGGAGGGSANLNTTYGDWSTKVGSTGATGGSNLSFQNYALIPSTAGSPVGIIFSDTNFGCGQRWGSAGGINAPQDPPYPPIAKATGVCYITYYIKN